jgi:aspartate aminotransferase
MIINATYIKESDKSETLLINEVSKFKEDSGETIFKFGFGQSPFFPPQHVIDRLKEYAHRKEYAAVQGIAALREAVAKFHNHYDGLSIKPENVIVGPGSKILIFSILSAFKKADVLVVTPSWVSYEPQTKLAKLNCIRIHTRFEQRWRLTPELIDQACANRDNSIPAVLIFNYPGNPDGLSYNENELKLLSECFRRHNILVISDEIYGLLNHENNHLSLAQFYPEGTIVTGGLSKWCGAGGWRLGVALFPSQLDPKLKETIIGIASETYSCAAAPVQFAAIEAYQIDKRCEKFLDLQRQILSCAGKYMHSQLQEAGVNVHAPQGAFYLNPDFEPFREKLAARGITTSEALCASLLKEQCVAILPGTSFGYPSNQLVARIAYVDFDGTKALEGAENYGKSLDQEFLNQYCPKIVEGTQRMVAWLR